MQAERGPSRGLRLSGRNVVQLSHPRQHGGPPVQRVHRVHERIVLARIFHHPGQHRRLRQRQVLGRRVEVTLRGHLDTDGLVVEIDGVEIGGEQLILGHLVLDLDRYPQLADLPRGRLLGGFLQLLLRGRRQHQGVLHVLLCDRRAALGGVVLGVIDDRAEGALEVQRTVLVEPGVLDRDDRFPHHRRDLRVTHRDAVDRVVTASAAARVDVGERVAVLVQNLRADRQLPEGGHGQVVELVSRIAGQDPDSAHGGDSDRRDDQAGGRGEGGNSAGRACFSTEN